MMRVIANICDNTAQGAPLCEASPHINLSNYLQFIRGINPRHCSNLPPSLPTPNLLLKCQMYDLFKSILFEISHFGLHSVTSQKSF